MPKNPKDVKQDIKEEIIEIIKKDKKNKEAQEIYFTAFNVGDENYALLFAKRPEFARLRKNYFGILVTYNHSSGKVERWIDKDISVGSFTIVSKKEAKRAIINKVVETELEEKKEVLDSLNKRKDINNILLIGRTGDGKSALANVLINQADEKGEPTIIFGESECRVSKTDEVQSVEFKHEEVKYRVIDTPGISHTKSLEQEILVKIVKEVAQSIICEKLNQVFFVTSSKFTEEELKAYDILKDVIFDENIKNYTTVVCTKFSNFRSSERWGKDAVKAGDDRHSGSLGYDDLIYVDNPPLDIVEKETKQFSNEEIAEILGKKGESKEVWKERKDKNQCVYCCQRLEIGKDPRFSCEENSEWYFCSSCHGKVKVECERLKHDEEKICRGKRKDSRRVLLKRLEACQNKHYEANKDLKELSEEITNSAVKILILSQKIKELGRAREKPPRNEKLIMACEEEINELTNFINKKVENYIEKKNSSDSLLAMIGNLDKEQIVEKLRAITLEEVAQTSTKVLDTTVQFASLGGPPGLAVSLVLGVISSSIKLWLN